MVKRIWKDSYRPTPKWWGNPSHRKFSLVIFVLLAALDNAAIGIIPPLFGVISRDFSVNEALIGYAIAISLLVRGATAVIWGYLGDSKDRKKLLLWSTIIWSTATFLTGISKSLTYFFLFQIIAAVGLGCIEPLGFSLIGDMISPQKRGIGLSLWAICQSIGLGSGLLLAAYLGANNWRLPFLLISAAGCLFGFLYALSYRPLRGMSEPELVNVLALGRQYEPKIIPSELPFVFRNRTNAWLLLSHLLIKLNQGAFIWLPLLFIAKIEAEGYSLGTATLVGSLLTGLFSLGNYFTIPAGLLGDWLQRRNLRGRLFLSLLGTMTAIPLYLYFFLIPLQNLDIPVNSGSYAITIWILTSIIRNQSMTTAFLFAIVAVALSAIPVPNWSASVCDVNLPEHRSTIFGLGGLIGGIGGALGNGIMGATIAYFGTRFESPLNFTFAFVVLESIQLPLSLALFFAMRGSPQDILNTKSILNHRFKFLQQSRISTS